MQILTLQTVVGVPNGETLDGIRVVKGDVVLLTGQVTAAENGLYIVGEGRDGTLADLFEGMPVFVAQGSLCAGWVFVCTAANTDSVVFSAQQAPGPTQAAFHARYTEVVVACVPSGRA